MSLSRAICFVDFLDLASTLDAVARFQYQCILVTAPAHALPAASLDRLQALSAASPVAVLSAPPRWSQLASSDDGSLAWLVDGTLATTTVAWHTVDPTHPPVSVIPCGTLALGPYPSSEQAVVPSTPTYANADVQTHTSDIVTFLKVADVEHKPTKTVLPCLKPKVETAEFGCQTDDPVDIPDEPVIISRPAPLTPAERPAL
ncbi:hypothetical protein HDU96_004765, partial [Phlyctochytrium bullatum]